MWIHCCVGRREKLSHQVPERCPVTVLLGHYQWIYCRICKSHYLSILHLYNVMLGISYELCVIMTKETTKNLCLVGLIVDTINYIHTIGHTTIVPCPAHSMTSKQFLYHTFTQECSALDLLVYAKPIDRPCLPGREKLHPVCSNFVWHCQLASHRIVCALTTSKFLLGTN